MVSLSLSVTSGTDMFSLFMQLYIYKDKYRCVCVLNSENINTVSPGRGRSFPSAAEALASCMSFSNPLIIFRALSISRGPHAS